MTTFWKKSIILAALLATVTFAVSAYDGSVDTCLDLGTISRSDFQSEAETDAFYQDMYALLEEHLNAQGGSVERFFRITPQNLDSEDADLLSATESYLKSNFRIKNGSSFYTIIVRGATDEGADGWAIASNFASNKGLHYIFYFNAAF